MAVLFPISLLFTMKGNLGDLSKIDKELDTMSMRMRLTGRDLMRLGSTMGAFFGSLLGQIGNVLKGSLDWQAGLQDIQYSLEDVGTIIGDTLAPFLDIITGIIESLSGAMERVPFLKWVIILGILLTVFGYLVSKLIQFTGSMNIFLGIIMRSNPSVIGLGGALKSMVVGFTQGSEAQKDYIAKLLHGTKQTKLFAKEGGKGVGGLMDKLKGLKGGLKGALKGMAALTTAGILMALSFVAFQELGGPIEDLLGAISDALSPIFDYLGGIIDWIADCISNCPLLAIAFIAAFLLIGAGVVVLQKVLGKVADTFATKLSGGLDKVTGPMKNVGEGAWKNTLANAALVASIALLVFALGNFFSVLGSMGVSIWEAIAALGAVLTVIILFIVGLALCAKLLANIGGDVWIGIAAVAALVGIVILLTLGLTLLLIPLNQMPGGIANLYLLNGALLMLMGGLVAVAFILGTLGAVAFVGAVILVILAGAALMLGMAMLLAGMGIQMAARGIMELVSNAGAVVALVPAVLGLAAGLLLLGIAGILAFPALVLLSAGLLLLTAAIIALGGALLLLKAAGLGGVAEAIGGGLATVLVPHLQEGGIITAGGVAVLHPGEEVRPASVVKKKMAEPIQPLVIQINAPIGSREIAASFANDIERILDRRYKRSR